MNDFMLKVMGLVATVMLGAMVAHAEGMADDPVDGSVVEVSARYVFAPKGFDDNDDAVFMVDGYLPSGCYRLIRPEVVVDHVNKRIAVKPMARYYDIPCVEALIPYQFEVQVGTLSIGDYTIAVAASSVSEAMPVAEATNAGPDDYLYAPIDGARVFRDDRNLLVAELTGRFTNSCMTFDEVVTQDNGKTINILPVIKMVGDDCVARETAFRKIVELPRNVSFGRKLLHVRSLNGKAINYLFYALPPRIER